MLLLFGIEAIFNFIFLFIVLFTNLMDPPKPHNKTTEQLDNQKEAR